MSRPLSGEEKIDWLRLARTENVGPVTFAWLISTHGSARAALDALPHISKRGGRAKPLAAAPKAEAERELEWAAAHNARIIAACEPEYPALLAHISDPPPLIMAIGSTSLLARPCVAIVGARNASMAGVRIAQQFARELGAGGCTIVSGLARGIDTAAHKGALDTGTAAIMAGGIDVVYPPENRALYDDIAQRGVLLSEIPPGTQPTTHHFPRRNRIVSGLSLATVVVEAAARSGSLITARFALEQGREVFAVPGSPLDPRSFGPNQLIKDGAGLATSAADILDLVRTSASRMSERQGDLFASPRTDAPTEAELAASREIFLEKLGTSAITIDEIARECHFSCAILMALLAELELAGRIARLPGNRICLVPEET